MRFYRNPNILLKKLCSEASVDFVSRLKQFLLDGKQPEEDPQVALFKNTVDGLKTKINQLLDYSLTGFGSGPVTNGHRLTTTRNNSNGTE